MALTLTQAQIDQIRILRDAGPQNKTVSNPLGDYSHIYKYIGDQLESSDEKNWFLGAEQANSGQGAYSAMIRGYRQAADGIARDRRVVFRLIDAGGIQQGCYKCTGRYS